MATVPTYLPSPARRGLSKGFRVVRDFGAAHPALAQGAYYALVGLWPWLSMESFLWVTGKKTDLWLVQTLGLLVAVVGGSLCVAAARRDESWAMTFLALGTAAALASADLLFVSQGRIPAVYLLDAAVEAGLAALWVIHWRSQRLGGRPGVRPR